MTKGLKELKRLPNAIKDTFKDSFDIIKKELKDKEKKDKALDIIKKHPMFYLHDDLPQGTYKMYDCELYSNYDLTKEEFNLLKEVLDL